MLIKKMTLADLTKKAYEEGRRLIAPLMGFPGVDLINTTIKITQQNYGVHYEVLKALVETFRPDIIFTLMDLSVEANALGEYTLFPKQEAAVVAKHEFQMEDLEHLRKINISFDSRLNCYVETMKLMRIGLPKEVLKGAYVTGPYTLAALIMGAKEAAMATKWQPEELHKLCDFTSEKIQEYTRLLLTAGADIICILEPSAVMLGPKSFGEFSASYVKQIINSCGYNKVNTVYHVCGNAMHAVEKMVESGVQGLSLDSKEAGIKLGEAVKRIPESVVIIGNINPVQTMLFGTPEDVSKEVIELLDIMKDYPNFILSTGCDLPREAPRANIEAFMKAGREYEFK